MFTNMKRLSTFLIALLMLMLMLCLSVGCLAEMADVPASSINSPDVQELFVTNTPVRGRIAVSKRGLMLKGFEPQEDGFGHVVHTPIYETDYLTGAVFEVRAAERIIGKDHTLWHQEGDLAAVIITTGNEMDASDLLPLGKYIVTET